MTKMRFSPVWIVLLDDETNAITTDSFKNEYENSNLIDCVKLRYA